jgi:hypothetical protein
MKHLYRQIYSPKGIIDKLMNIVNAVRNENKIVL